ncbi:hypothetical protein [Jiangella sp. DSM 45060]|uniref:hypothetical protein n=1 Tax=Jiangella sp. DSM 45060 TaxID=1798224 RepID=UPI00087DC257|nr:hypothetical protein [Jiangella sp. DSM 45060]SDT66327.1 hypothetical protein SAMN04515669_5590 [Jiangella sp. DSM 45060]
MSYEPYPDTLHRVRAADLEHAAVTAGLARRARRTRRLELAARLLDRLARRLEARACASRVRAI